MNDKQRLEQFRLQTRNYPQWDAAKYQRSVSNTFDRVVTNNSEYMSAMYDAASQNKPIVMMLGKGSDAASRHIIENSLKDSRGRNGRDAVYVFVDLDRVDPNSAIGKYAFENMPRKGQEPPFTMVFGMSRGDSTNPIRADQPSFYRMGPVDQISINEAVSRLKLQMTGRFNIARPTDQVGPAPDSNPGPRPDANPVDPRIQEAFTLALVQAQRQNDKQAAYNHYKQAVDLADSVRNPSLQSAARVELGLSCLNWGFSETGLKWIMEGGSKNPALYDNRQNQPFKTRLRQGGMPERAIDLLIQQGQKDPNWYLKDREAGQKIETAMRASAPPSVVPDKQAMPGLDGQPILPTNHTDRQPSPSKHLRTSPFR